MQIKISHSKRFLLLRIDSFKVQLDKFAVKKYVRFPVYQICTFLFDMCTVLIVSHWCFAILK